MSNWHTRYRRIIDAYRNKLMEVNPKACDQVDDQMYSRGETWIADQRPIDPDKMMTAREIAERFGYNEHNIRDWARRHPDRIQKHKVGGKTLFLLREVLSYQAGKP